MLDDIFIMSIDSLFESPLVFCRKDSDEVSDDPEAWRFLIDYRKSNVITQNSQFSIPVISECWTFITNLGS